MFIVSGETDLSVTVI